ncbi:MAG: LysR family transcriptional regulator [Porticoccaceae bacterium]
MSEWDDLRFFLAVARAGSISGAANQLGVNHSTVSRRINAYEKSHDVRLFERVQTGYELTAAGEHIRHYALEIEQRVQSVERELFGRDVRLQGTVRLTCYHGVATQVIVPELARFRAQYPDIDLELMVSTDVRDLSAREADIAVRGTKQPPDHLIGRRVTRFVHGIYTSDNYIKRALKQDELVLWRDDPETFDWVQTYYPEAKVALRVDDVATMVAAVQAGLGIARLPCHIADQYQLYRMRIEFPPSEWGIWILSHADLRATARVRVCREFLVSLFEEKKDLLEGRCSRYL